MKKILSFHQRSYQVEIFQKRINKTEILHNWIIVKQVIRKEYFIVKFKISKVTSWISLIIK